MRVCLSLCAALLFTTVAATAPLPLPSPRPPSSPHASPSATSAHSGGFALQLVMAVNLIGGIYVRPVERADLLEAALAGLYEAVRRPVPRNLRRRIEQAEKAVRTAVLEVDSPTPAPLVPALAPPRRASHDERPLLELIGAVYAEAGKAEERDAENALRIACQAMLRSLDPYSGVITATEHHRTIGLPSEREGFGLEVVTQTAARLVIKDVLPGSSAQRAGLRPGDEITQVRDSDGRERKLSELLDVLNGRTPLVKPQLDRSGTPEPIEVTFRRPSRSSRAGTGTEKRGGEQTAVLDWQRFRPESVFGVARRDDNSWNYWLDGKRKIAHLRFGNLLETTPDELFEIVSDLRRDGLRGLILDLRWCPGGSLSGSRKSAEWFLGEGTIATVRWRNRPEDVYRSTNEDKLGDFPMVVLINGDTIGGGELIAAALQDHRRAVLVGQRTRGKGNVQSITEVGPIGLKITSGTLIRPNGKNLHRFPDSKPGDDWGVSPDPGREFRISADLGRALQQWWEQQTMRPGSSTERLPLDDPLLDPQRNAAVEALLEQMDRPVRVRSEVRE